jgi:hypothetical protein
MTARPGFLTVASMEAAIEVSGLRKRFGPTVALDGRECALAVPARRLAALDGIAFTAHDTPVSKDLPASHEDDTKNETTGRRRRWCWARPRRTGVLAITAGLVLLSAACGGSPGAVRSPSASVSPGGVRGRSVPAISVAGGLAVGQSCFQYPASCYAPRLFRLRDPGAARPGDRRPRPDGGGAGGREPATSRAA